MKLAAKLVSVLVAAITVLFAVDAFITLERESELLQENKRLTARLFGRTLEQFLIADGLPKVRFILEEINRQQEDVHVRWIPERDAPWRTADIESDSLPPTAIQSGEPIFYRLVDAGGNDRMCTYVRVTPRSQSPAGVEISEPWPHRNRALRRLIVHVVTMTGLMVAVAAVVAMLLGAEMVGRPLKLLIEKTRRVGQGDLSGPIQIRGEDELSELAAAINTMCQELVRSQERFRQEEAARMEAIDQLRHVDRLRTVGGLASGVAHELGTPLSVVAGRASLIASGKLAPEEVTASAEAIKTESQRMTKIIQQLLDFARRKTPQKTLLDLNQLARQTVSLLDPLARKQDILLRMAEPAEAMSARVDAGQVQQVLTNLLVNAIQATPAGGVVDIRISRRNARRPTARDEDESGYAYIEIIDHGTGITPEHREHLFEPFFTTKDVGQGTGLGLSIAYGIVDEHGGWIDVESRPGEGSRFSVFLPAEQPA
jgi:signal transduction histidine kinase